MTRFQFGTGERWALVAALAYTIVNTTLRAAAPSIDPALGSLVRLIPVAIVAWVFVARGRVREFRPDHPAFLGWRLVAALVGGGMVSFVLGNILYFRALTDGGLGITVSGIQAGSVLGGLWLGALALRERPSRAQLAGAGLVIAGLGGVGIAQTGGSVGDLWWLGLLFALAAGTTYAISNTLTGIVQRQRPLLWVTLAGSSLGGVVPLAILVGWRLAADPGGVAYDLPSIGVVLLAGCSNAVALAALAMAVRTAPVASVNTVGSAAVVLSFIASVVLFDETGSLPMIAGVLLVTAGIAVAQLRRPQPGSAPSGSSAAFGPAPAAGGVADAPPPVSGGREAGS